MTCYVVAVTVAVVMLACEVLVDAELVVPMATDNLLVYYDAQRGVSLVVNIVENMIELMR